MKTLHRYQTSMPRIAFSVSAVALTAITMGVLVVMPARMEGGRHEPGTRSGDHDHNAGSTGAVSGHTTDLGRPDGSRA